MDGYEDAATGRAVKQRNARFLSQCPRFNHEDEHLLHVLTCTTEDTIELRENLLQNWYYG